MITITTYEQFKERVEWVDEIFSTDPFLENTNHEQVDEILDACFNFIIKASGG